jgi:hypothetical protein
MANKTTINIGSASIILDWDDGQWYISDIKYSNDNETTENNIIEQNNIQQTTTNVKLAEWNENYKYQKDDLVAYKGNIYRSQQNTNLNNEPDKDTFWWKPFVDLTHIDAETLEGMTVAEIAKYTLGGHSISEYYTITEVNNQILKYFNNVDAKKLNGWTLDDIKNDYTTLINNTKTELKNWTINYLESDDFQNPLISYFDEHIAPDDINKI